MSRTELEIARYALELSFMGEKDWPIETHRTANVSIIGGFPTADFERQLSTFEFSMAPGTASPEEWISAKWAKRKRLQVASYACGLIAISESAPAALEALEREVQAFLNSGVNPLIAWPGSIQRANQIKRQLAGLRGEWHLVRTQLPQGTESGSGAAFIGTVIKCIEGLLIGPSCPGLVCIDPSDLWSVLAAGECVKIQWIETDSIGALLESVRRELKVTSNAPGLVATIFGPRSLSLRQVHTVMNAVRSQVPQESCTAFAAPTYVVRDRYILFLAVCE